MHCDELESQAAELPGTGQRKKNREQDKEKAREQNKKR